MISSAKKKDWFSLLAENFTHPSIVLWRALELQSIERAVAESPLEPPLLDLGCAEGIVAGLFFEGRRMVGIDTEWDFLKKNTYYQTYSGLAQADACRMPFQREAFNTVFSNCVIEHIPDLHRLLTEVHAVLKPGGKLLFTVPSASFGDNLSVSACALTLRLRALARWYARFRNSSLHHHHCYDHGQWKELLVAHGLKLRYHAYYMSRRMTVIWDILAIIWRVLTAIRVPPGVLRGLNIFLIKRLQKYYNMYSTSGSALVVVAEKVL